MVSQIDLRWPAKTWPLPPALALSAGPGRDTLVCNSDKRVMGDEHDGDDGDEHHSPDRAPAGA